MSKDEYKKAFAAIDTDNDGFIDAKELNQLFRSIYIELNDTEVKEIVIFLWFCLSIKQFLVDIYKIYKVGEFDKNKNGKIDFEEFIALDEKLSELFK